MKEYQQQETYRDREREFQILEYNGISKHKGKKKVKKKYCFLIYQFDVVAIFQTTQSQSGGQPWLPNADKRQKELWKRVKTQSREVNKTKKLAIRTLYLLGYDLGVVEVCVHSHRPVYTVSQIVHQPRLAEQFDSTLKQLTQRSQELEEENVDKSPKLGADIEFALRHTNGKYVVASKYFTKRGKVGYDAIWLKGSRNKHPLVELRPSPSKNPRHLFNRLHRCMVYAIKRINNPKIEWIAGGNPLKHYPIGGHIHFSQINLTPKFIRSLDNYLTLPLSMLESKESISRRPKYGFLGDFREQFHGGFEYRTPPSWIVSPTIANGVLCLAKVIAKDYHRLTYFPFESEDVHREFYAGNREELYPYVNNVWKALRGCPSYTKYKSELDQFFELIETRFVWNEYDDIRKAWQLPPYD